MPFHLTILTIGLLSLCACAGPLASAKSDEIGAPVSAGTSANAPDPAVIYANANRSGDIGYNEGYFGDGDGRLHYVEAGKGPLVILVHGFPSFWYSWFDQMEALKSRYRVVAVDALGSGLSAKPQSLDPYKIVNLARLLDSFSRHLVGNEKYILIGHDWGSVLALSYAQAYAFRLRKVVGMSAPPLNVFLGFLAKSAEQQKRSQYMQAMRETTLDQLRRSDLAGGIGRDSYKSLVERGDLFPEEAIIFQRALSDPERLNAAINWYRANIPPVLDISDADLWPSPGAQLKIPALFIWGEADQIFVPELITEMETAGPCVKVVRLPGINHWTSMENPELATQAIIDFIDK